MFLEKIVLAPKSSQRKSYIIHNIEANRETMNKSISIQNLNVYFFRVSETLPTYVDHGQSILNNNSISAARKNDVFDKVTSSIL